jgi:hypothetical protein
VVDGTVAAALVELVIATGPDHVYPVTLLAPLAFRLSVCPAQNGLLFEALVNDGTGLTLTVTVAVLAHPLLFVPVTVYVLVEDGLAVTLAPVVADRPVPGDHV